MKKKIIISLSGGIDSTQSLIILKKNNYYTEAIFIKNSIEQSDCYNSKKDLIYVKLLCKKKYIKLHIINISQNFWKEIFLPFIKNLKNGNTPNPDILCNKKIKFRILPNIVKKMNFNLLATGHYAKSIIINSVCKLFKSFNTEKDQTYFLSDINRIKLKYIIFPISNYIKKSIKNYIKKQKLLSYNKKNSTGICFIENKNFKLFIKKYITCENGSAYDEKKNIIGYHSGAAYYTIGEKIKFKNQMYQIYKKNTKENTIYVTQEPFQIKKLKTNKSKNIRQNYIFDFITRHQGNSQTCIINNSNHLITRHNKNLTSPGQHIVLYKNKECIQNSLIIKNITIYFKNKF